MVAFAAAAGCDAGAADEGDGEPATPAELGLAGAYDLQESWDLSSALWPETLGELASQIAIDLAIDALGVPAAARPEAEAALTELVGDRVRRPVADLASQSTELATVRDHIRAADVRSQWLLGDEEPHRERVMSLRYGAVTIDLSPVARGLEVSGPLVVSEAGGGELEAAELELDLGLGEALRPAAELPLELALAELDCGSLANAITAGDGGIEIRAGDTGYVATAAAIADQCEVQADSLAAAVLDRMDRELDVRLGGRFRITDGGVESTEYSGAVKSVPFVASFVGTAR